MRLRPRIFAALPVLLTAACTAKSDAAASQATGSRVAASAPRASSPSNSSQARDTSDVSATLVGFERALAQATLRRDSAALVRYEAPDAVLGFPDGTVATGAQDMKAVLGGAMDFQSYDLDSLEMRSFGTAAVVTGRARMRGYAGKQDISGQYRLQDVWVQRGGQWQLVASQWTSIPSGSSK